MPLGSFRDHKRPSTTSSAEKNGDWAVCCLFPEDATSRLAARFAPKKIKVRDVTVRVRPSFGVPFVPLPELGAKVDLGVLRFCQDQDLPSGSPEMPWHDERTLSISA